MIYRFSFPAGLGLILDPNGMDVAHIPAYRPDKIAPDPTVEAEMLLLNSLSPLSFVSSGALRYPSERIKWI